MKEGGGHWRLGASEESEVKTGLRQGSDLSPLLFIAVMDLISRKTVVKDAMKKLLLSCLVLSCLVLSCLGDYVSVTAWYDETVRCRPGPGGEWQTGAT